MAGSVIIRAGTSTVDQRIIHDDRPVSWEEADRLAGRRLDRRKAWAFVEGQLCESVQWTEGCSGCTYGFEDRGGGCDECGYQGRVRNGMWVQAEIAGSERQHQ
ncbi:conserved hypothetical protein [Sphingomonas sp. AX6]|nr:conserved hypothetical protein [Sphingomonas sp. AX6]